MKPTYVLRIDQRAEQYSGGFDGRAASRRATVIELRDFSAVHAVRWAIGDLHDNRVRGGADDSSVPRVSSHE